MVIKGEAVHVAKIPRLIDPQDDRFHEAVEAAEQVRGRDFMKIPRADRMLDRLEEGVLADALRSAQNQSVIEFLSRQLHAVRQPFDDMGGVLGAVDRVGMVDPRAGFSGVAELDPGRTV
jgi:hypothetical protein